MPAATPVSEIILNALITPVCGTCVPAQNSLEKSPIVTTRTLSPYFSPNNAIAPVFFASSTLMISVLTVRSSAIFSFTIFSTSASSSAVNAWK